METQFVNEVIEKLGIPSKELAAIVDLIYAFPKNDLSANVRLLERLFLHNIKPYHYLVLGHLIGQMDATESAFIEIFNNNKPCQRLN